MIGAVTSLALLLVLRASAQSRAPRRPPAPSRFRTSTDLEAKLEEIRAKNGVPALGGRRDDRGPPARHRRDRTPQEGLAGAGDGRRPLAPRLVHEVDDRDDARAPRRARDAPVGHDDRRGVQGRPSSQDPRRLRAGHDRAAARAPVGDPARPLATTDSGDSSGSGRERRSTSAGSWSKASSSRGRPRARHGRSSTRTPASRSRVTSPSARRSKPWEDLMRDELFEPLGMTARRLRRARVERTQSTQPWGHHGVGVDARRARVPTPTIRPRSARRERCTRRSRTGRSTRRCTCAAPRGKTDYLKPETFARIQAQPKVGDYAFGWGHHERPWANGHVLSHSGQQHDRGSA